MSISYIINILMKGATQLTWWYKGMEINIQRQDHKDHSISREILQGMHNNRDTAQAESMHDNMIILPSKGHAWQ